VQLDQHSIVIVMVVVFSSTLLISAGLMFAMLGSASGRLWAFGHLVLSGGGLVLALNAGSEREIYFGALGVMVYFAGRLIVYCGIRVHHGMTAWSHRLTIGMLIALAAIASAISASDSLARLHLMGYGALAILTVVTMRQLLRAVREHSPIGTPLVLAACAVQLISQLAGVVGGLRGAPLLSPMFAGGPVAILLLAPLIATLLGLFGFTVMAMEQIVASKERGARMDGLTGLLNRGALDGAAMGLVASWLRYRQPLSCLVIDVDYFKQVNDRSGHWAGDAVLKAIAGALDQSRRASDVAGRYGGEEFCILCPNTDESQATALASRILRKVRSVPLPGKAGAFASVSIGIAELQGATDSAEMLWQRLFCAADQALYIAKRNGRDRYVLASTLEPPMAGQPEAVFEPAADPQPT
jgi:diguanylate cyclase (GGDEF)-like protein